jgi:hypothetical protein
VKLPSRPLQSTAALIASVLAVLAFEVAPAGAIVETVGVAKVNAGLQPRSTSLLDGFGPEAETFANPSGAPVLASNKTYAIYWDPTDHYHGDWQHVIDTFFQRMGADSGSLASVFAVDAQYTDAANHHALYKSTFMGAYTDTEPYPVATCEDPKPLAGTGYPSPEPDKITCLTNQQIQEQLASFITKHSLPKGMGTIFYVLTPPGVTVCLDAGGSNGHCSDYETSSPESYDNSFCSYHSDINPDNAVTGDANTILYSAIPWTAGGLADGHLGSMDQTPAYDCQDGGFDPSSKPIEEKEHIKPHTKKEEEEFSKETPQETREREEAEALELEKPHQQEPNQVPCPSPDGFCDTGLADLIINQIGIEQQNVVTDPLLSSWKDGKGNEATDECRNFFAPVLGGSVTANPQTFAGTLYNQSLNGGKYYLNDAFNLAALKLPYPAITCLPGIRLEPQFTAPNPVNTGEVVGFDGMESDITLNWGTIYSGSVAQPTYASYTWNFGDGTPTVTGFAPGAPWVNSGNSPCSVPWMAPCAASAFHSYKYGGAYAVTLTVTDTGGNTTSVTNPITVEGPPPPSPPSEPASGSSASGAPGSSGSPSSSGVTTKPVPAPVASQAIVSRSLAKTIRGGLVARYSVNEQVTGHFEVLLAASIAHRLGLHGPLAAGLATGTPPQVIIAKALLVTTKAGSNTLKLQFGKITAKRLRRLHTVPLMLRLTVRNAGGGTTTVLSKIALR